jgi:glycosyltransferase involved in cell wall biosynthesis
MGGDGSKYLRQLLQTIQVQSHNNYEVIISDHSTDNNIMNVVNNFNNKKFHHIFNSNFKGSSSGNVNFAIKNSNGNKIKVMFQDDFFVNKDALSIINEQLNEHAWVISSCIHYKTATKEFFRPHYPYWQDDIKKGNNTLGGPSVLSFQKCDAWFDINLLWFMDIDFYYKLFKIYGKPFIENKILVGIREEDTRVSSTMITSELVERETKIIKERFSW